MPASLCRTQSYWILEREGQDEGQKQADHDDPELRISHLSPAVDGADNGLMRRPPAGRAAFKGKPNHAVPGDGSSAHRGPQQHWV
jgi:hypothetical protein